MFERESTSRQVANLERPGYEFWLRRLTLPEIAEFLYHQMLCFDFNRRTLFTREMAYFLAERSEGVFARINDLARQAMSFADLESGDTNRPMMAQVLMTGQFNAPEVSDANQNFLSKHRGALIAALGVSVVVSIASGIALLG